MRYLFFDIECCDGRHICEFGYVISDENFNVLEQAVITINPEMPFNLTGRVGQDDIELFFSEDVYYTSPTFSHIYNRLCDLLEYQDQIVIGHAVNNDAIFLRTACKRYKLAPINFRFSDSQHLYSEFSNNKRSISLLDAEEVFNLKKPKYLHKSDEDALLTLRLTEAICQKLEVSLPELLAICPTACGESKNFGVNFFGNSLSERLATLERNENALSQNKRQKCVKEFAERVEFPADIVQSCLTGKKLCFSSSFEKNYTKNTIVLIQLLASHGCQYNTKVSENDFYIASEDELASLEIDMHTRYYSATHREGDNSITVLSLDQLLEILNITSSKLRAMAMPTLSKTKPHKKATAKNSQSTIGEQLRAKGIDLSKLFS